MHGAMGARPCIAEGNKILSTHALALVGAAGMVPAALAVRGVSSRGGLRCVSGYSAP